MRRLLLALAVILLSSSASFAANRFLVLCTTSCTWDNTNDAIWSTTSGGTNNTTHPVAGDTVTIDANSCVGGATCTITGGAVTLAMSSLTMGACTATTAGCIVDFSANNTNLTISTLFSNSGTGTRTLNMGNGTWNMTCVNCLLFDQATTTNLTFNANSSTVLINATVVSGSRSANFGNKAMNIVTITGPTTPAGASFGFILTGPSTITTLNLNSPLYVRFTLATTATITNLNVTGSSATSVVQLAGTANGGGSATTLSVASGTPGGTWATLTDITCSGGGAFAFTNSFDLQHNTTCGITPPAGGATGRIIGGWLFNRDLSPANDNTPAFLDAAA